jgi:hypothetical protein
MGLWPTHRDESALLRFIDSKQVTRDFRGSFHGPVGPPIEMKINPSGAYDRRTWTAKVVSTLDEVRP